MIKVYNGFETDFCGQGLGYVDPIRAEIEEEAAGLYEIEIEVPINENRDDWVIDHQRIISAKAPTRTSPELNFGLNGEIERQIFKMTGSAPMYSEDKTRLLGYAWTGMEVVRLSVENDWYKAITVIGGIAGWLPANMMIYDRTETENVEGDSASNVVETVLAREQLFRICTIKRDTAKMMLTARAEHISYDLKGIICEQVYEPQNIPADEVVAQLLAKADRKDHPFHIYCQCTNLITGEYTGRNLIDCLLNSDDGIVKQCGARIVRDNFNIYILNMEDRYTGSDIRYGDNMIKAVQETESGEALSRIRPVGKNKNGDRLYINENNGYVDSPNAANFAVQRTKEIEYSEATTGREGLVNDWDTIQKLKELAQAEFENGADAITQKIDAEFVRKELTQEFVDSANEHALHMYDIAHVRAHRAGVVASVRMTYYKFDALPGRERYIDAKISDLVESEPMVYGIDIGNNSVSGTKLRDNSIDGNRKIKNLSVGIGKFDKAAIEQLNANSITALIARINEIVAGTITTDELYAAFAEMIALKVGSLTASDITTDRLAAALAAFTVISAGNADFDLASIKNLLANALILQEGIANSMQIVNLAITSANIMSATLGELVLKGEDGKYYHVSVGSDGTISTEEATVSEDEITAGQTTTGKQIVETTANIADLNAQTIKAQSAIIASIFTDALTAGKITAGQALISSATIPELYTTSVNALGDSMTFSANTLIQFMLGISNNVNAWFRFTDDAALEIGRDDSTYYTSTDNEGFHVNQRGVGRIGSFAKRTLRTDNLSINNSGLTMKKSSKGGIRFVRSD